LLDAHLRRLRDSARCLGFEVPAGDGELAELVAEAIERFGESDGYLRLVVTRGRGQLGVSPHSCERPTTILIAASLQLYPAELYEQGLDVVTSTLRRASADSLPPQVKSLNYLTSVLAAAEARARGAHEALLLNAAGEICECTADNVFFVRDGAVSTPPVAGGALDGITRGHVIALLRSYGIDVCEKVAVLADAWTADEAFLTGTGAEVVPIASIDGRRLAAPGPVTLRAQQLFARSLPSFAALNG
jgi:branched-chain amino acid aminotransferase